MTESVIQRAHRFLSAHDDSQAQGHPERVEPKNARMRASYVVLKTAFELRYVIKWQSVIGTASSYSVLEIHILLSHIIKGHVLYMLIGSGRLPRKLFIS